MSDTSHAKDLHALTGAYVMDALDPEEREAFEAYMATSPATAAEVESLREAAGMLGSAAAATPPEGLRRSVLDEIDTTRQLPPEVTSIRQAPSAPPATTQQPGASPWVSRISLAAAAVAVLVAVGLGITLANLGDRLDSLEQTNAQVATLLAAEDATRREVGLPDGGVITALISEEHGAAVAVAEGLPELDAERMYALWGLVDGSPVPVGELVNGEPLTIQVAGLDALGLTVEPRGELTLPTGSVQATLNA